jgi:hypothetical protein
VELVPEFGAAADVCCVADVPAATVGTRRIF